MQVNCSRSLQDIHISGQSTSKTLSKTNWLSNQNSQGKRYPDLRGNLPGEPYPRLPQEIWVNRKKII